MEQYFLLVVGAVLSLLGTLVTVNISGVRSDFREVSQDIKGMKKSVDDLNVKIAEVIKDQDWHREEINEIKKRLRSLEQ